VNVIRTAGSAAIARRALAAGLGLAALVAVSSPDASAAPAAPASAPVSGGAVATTGVRPLGQLAAEATAIVLATVSRSETYDEGRLRLHRLRVERVIRGRLEEPEPGIVDILGDPSRPPLVGEGERAVFLLRPQPPLSYLDQQLPAAPRFATVAARDGILPVGSEAEVDAIERALAQCAAIASIEDDAAGRAARRKLAFFELGTTSPRLAADAVVELGLLTDLAPVTPDEITAIGRTLRDPRVDARTRIGLMELLANRGLREALPALAGAEAESPAVLDALLAAKTKLGAPPTRADLRPYLDEKDPALRAVAVRALARLDDPDALADVGRAATSDADVSVRTAAVDALGKTKKPAAVPILRQTFGAPEPAVRQASARALADFGDPAADNALVDLALKGENTDVQTYAAIVLVVSRGRDSEPVRRLEQSNPSPAVRDLLTHGLRILDKHGAE
jgi:HEAT repeats